MIKKDVVLEVLEEARRLSLRAAALRRQASSLLEHVFVLSHDREAMLLCEDDFVFLQGQWVLIADLAERWQRIISVELLRDGNHGVVRQMEELGALSAQTDTDAERDTAYIYLPDAELQRFILRVNAWVRTTPILSDKRRWGSERADDDTLKSWLAEK